MKSIADLRRFAASSLAPPASLEAALDRAGFVQADPIRAPARAQDLTLRPRVAGYRAGDLDRRYATLPVEEDFFINYGFVTRRLQALMHPRAALSPTASNKRARAILEFVRERGEAHPRDVDGEFAHGRTTNYWGGNSSVTTRLLEDMHYKGLLRVARRDKGIRVYAVQEHGAGPIGAAARRANLDGLVDTVVGLYAPVPAASLSYIISRLRYATPHWRAEIRPAFERAKQRLAHATIDGHTWYWPDSHRSIEGEPDRVHLLAPFDPVVWDRKRFELLWDWAYRFEAYTPEPKRKLGYYALPMLWRDRAIGWANISVRNNMIVPELGYVSGRAPRDRGFKPALERELDAMRAFLLER